MPEKDLDDADIGGCAVPAGRLSTDGKTDAAPHGAEIAIAPAGQPKIMLHVSCQDSGYGFRYRDPTDNREFLTSIPGRLGVMDTLSVGLVALLASGFSLFSGFELSTILMPVEVAGGTTALVQLANNTFNRALVELKAARPERLRFAVPAVIAASPGAPRRHWGSDPPKITTWTAFGNEHPEPDRV